MTDRLYQQVMLALVEQPYPAQMLLKVAPFHEIMQGNLMQPRGRMLQIQLASQAVIDRQQLPGQNHIMNAECRSE
ncbi:hypothetical protein D3C85_1828720 [compost metagenome]